MKLVKTRNDSVIDGLTQNEDATNVKQDESTPGVEDSANASAVVP